MTNLTPTPLIADVAGYYAPFDGGGGRYYYDPTDSTTPDNGGTVIAPSASPGRWRLTPPYAISVKTFGAKGDGTTDDTAAFIAAYAAAPTGGIVLIPPPASSYNVGTVPYTKMVTWQADYDLNGTALISLPGKVVTTYAASTGIFYGASPPTDYAAFRVDRIASGSGGTNGFVNSTVAVNTTTLSGVKSYSWGVTSLVEDNNTSADGTQNVAVYGTIRKHSTGLSWAGCFEVTDYYTTPGTGYAGGNAIGIEVTASAAASSTDPNFTRVGVNVAGHIANGTAGAEWGRAFWASAVPNFRYREVYSNQATWSKAVLYNNGAGTTTGSEAACFIRDDGSAPFGIDLSRATYTSSNTAIALANNQVIRFNGPAGNVYAGYYPASAQFVISGANVMMPSGFGVTSGMRSSTASAGTITPPSLVSGFLTFYMDGAPYHIPYYG